MTNRHRIITAIFILLPILASTNLVLAVEPEAGTFSDTWRRADLPVRQGNADRTWIWGPEANTFVQWEPYAEARDGLRLVQYFDKARMEDNSFRGGLPWNVTTGLLVVEMMSGEVQVGDREFETARNPASINIAGDQGEFESSPTYASLSNLRERADIRTDEVVSERVNRAGEVSTDPALAARGVTMVHFDGTTGHNVAAPFWNFMNSTGLVDINGELTNGPLFPNQFFAVGRPITEPYWATVPVAGTDKDVLLQCFERRCLTYTADNPDGWQVEAGNVGAHYYEWRYGEPQGQIAFSRDGDLWIMEGNGANPRPIAATTAFDSQPLWSPNRTDLLFVRSDADAVPPDRNYGLWGANIVTGEERYLTSLRTSGPYPKPSFDWSSDGRQVVASNGTDIEVINYATGAVTQRFDDVGFVFDVDWSPADPLILFRSESPPGGQSSGFYMLNPTNDQIAHIPGTTAFDAQQEWSPDGSMILFQSRPPESTLVDLYLLGPGVSDREVDRILIAQEIETVQPRWSPSGDLIAYVMQDQIRIANLDDLDSEHQTLSKIREFDFPRYLTWSPDSTAIAANLGYLWVSSLSNEQHNLSATEAVGPDWSP